MTKVATPDLSPTSTESSTPNGTTLDAAITQSFWLLKEGIAPKLGARAEGSISYNVLADTKRQQLFIAITANKGGGYFSKEEVAITAIEACLDASSSAKSFPSKTFRQAFVGRSSNNAGFLVTALRNEGLIAAAPDAEMQHVRSGDWAAWKKTMLAEAGRIIELGMKGADKKAPNVEQVADHNEHIKTLSLPRKK